MIKHLINIVPLLILLGSCRAFYTEGVVVESLTRPQYKKRMPNKDDSLIVDSFFKDWLTISNSITRGEYKGLDSVSRFGYEVYESLMIDTTFIGIGKGLPGFKYFLVPYEFRVGIAKNYTKKYGFLTFDSIETFVIKDFRPNLKIENQLLYFTDEYQDTLPKFAEKYGVGGYIRLDSYLMSNHLRYYETAPVIYGFTYLKDSGFYIIDYKEGSCSYETLVKRQASKWIKIKDLIILTSD